MTLPTCWKIAVLVLLYAGIPFGTSAHSLADEYFSLPTADHKAKIEGSITLPNIRSAGKLAPIVIIGGSYATSDGDVFVSESDPFWNAKFWLKDLGDKIAARNFAVIRFNNRGIHSSLDCARLSGKFVNAADYVANEKCYDAEAAGTTTYLTQESDIKAVIAMVERDPRFDASKTVLVVHSEGTFHVSKLLVESAIQPAGILFLGAPMDSPARTSRWQEVDRQMTWVEKSVKRNGGFFSNEDVKRRLHIDLDGTFYSSAPLLSNSGGWTMKNLPQLLVQLNDVAVLDLKTVLSSPPESPITSPIGDLTSSATIVLAENVHWHSALTDSFRPIDALRTYQGNLFFVYGENDIAIPREESIALIRKTKFSAHTMKVFRLKNADHGLRFKDKSLNGNAEEQVVSEIIRMEKSMGSR